MLRRTIKSACFFLNIQDLGQSGVLLVHAVKAVGQDFVLNFEHVREDPSNVLVLTNSKKIVINNYAQVKSLLFDYG